ncbi:hypothetical protein Tco_0182315, partial [Tanacetum coccineum]
LEDCLELKDATTCHLKISAITPPGWKGFLDNHPDVDLLDLHDHYYARQAVVDNVVNRRSRELLKVIEKLSGEADVMSYPARRSVSLSALELKDATACHLKIFSITPPVWKGFLDNHPDVDLLDGKRAQGKP